MELHQFKDQLQKALGSPTGRSVNGPECGHGLKRQALIADVARGFFFIARKAYHSVSSATFHPNSRGEAV
jgi:hypothetical protein